MFSRYQFNQFKSQLKSSDQWAFDRLLDEFEKHITTSAAEKMKRESKAQTGLRGLTSRRETGMMFASVPVPVQAPPQVVHVPVPVPMQGVPIPNLRGLALGIAGIVLLACGLRQGDLTEVFSNDVEIGHVVDQTPVPGHLAHRHAQVSLALSKGPES